MSGRAEGNPATGSTTGGTTGIGRPCSVSTAEPVGTGRRFSARSIAPRIPGHGPRSQGSRTGEHRRAGVDRGRVGSAGGPGARAPSGRHGREAPPPPRRPPPGRPGKVAGTRWSGGRKPGAAPGPPGSGPRRDRRPEPTEQEAGAGVARAEVGEGFAGDDPYPLIFDGHGDRPGEEVAGDGLGIGLFVLGDRDLHAGHPAQRRLNGRSPGTRASGAGGARETRGRCTGTRWRRRPAPAGGDLRRLGRTAPWRRVPAPPPVIFNSRSRGRPHLLPRVRRAGSPDSGQRQG